MKKVLIPTKLNPAVKAMLENTGNYTAVIAEGDIAALAKEHSDAWAMIVRSEKVTPEVIDAMPSLKLIVRAGSGFDTINTKYARSGIIRTSQTPMNVPATAMGISSNETLRFARSSWPSCSTSCRA